MAASGVLPAELCALSEVHGQSYGLLNESYLQDIPRHFL